jgi:hypothetical protein
VFQFPPTTAVTPGTPTSVTNEAISVPELELTVVVTVVCVPLFGINKRLPEAGLAPPAVSR